jgi:hypothetical protein
MLTSDAHDFPLCPALCQDKRLHIGREIGDGPANSDECRPKAIASPPRKSWHRLAQDFRYSLGLQQTIDAELGGVLGHGYSTPRKWRALFSDLVHLHR